MEGVRGGSEDVAVLLWRASASSVALLKIKSWRWPWTCSAYHGLYSESQWDLHVGYYVRPCHVLTTIFTVDEGRFWTFSLVGCASRDMGLPRPLAS